uniref:Uncharacterized protein n=1 Tax=Arundo donax TaxID=35708 RepID=A0A0A9AWR4_ARUDO
MARAAVSSHACQQDLASKTCCACMQHSKVMAPVLSC